MNNSEDQRLVVYVDMDFTLCDFGTAYLESKSTYPEIEFPHSIPGFFQKLAPIEDAIETYNWLTLHDAVDAYILTAPSIRNPHSYIEKRLWIERWLGLDACRNLIITPHKGLNMGDFLIDDQAQGKGQESFEGTLIQFGSSEFPNWRSIKHYFETLLSKS